VSGSAWSTRAVSVGPVIGRRRRFDLPTRKQGKWKTHEEIEREQQEAYRKSQQGVLGKLKDLVGGKA
jgi:hypothetical protein